MSSDAPAQSRAIPSPEAPLAAMPAETQGPRPGCRFTPEAQRFAALDVVRGLAILGIFTMNVISFGRPMADYFSPYFTDAWRDVSSLDKIVWYVQSIFFDQKFMSIFTMLYGAGLVLSAGRRSAVGVSEVPPFLRRSALLFVIGTVHAYAFWFGDVLAIYAGCGLIVFWFRGLSVKWLLGLGIAGVLAMSLVSAFFGATYQFASPQEQQALDALAFSTPEEYQRQIDAYRGSWLEQMPERAGTAFMIAGFMAMYGWLRTAGLMLIGMGLYKAGVMSGERRVPGVWMACLAVGLPLAVFGTRLLATSETGAQALFLYPIPNQQIASALIAVALIALIAPRCASTTGPLQKLLSLVGRCALSVYLLQTLISTFVFYGHGLGLFGQLERPTLLLAVVPVMWIICIGFAVAWLNHFRQGPAEWLLRCAVYWSWQPLRKSQPTPAATGGAATG